MISYLERFVLTGKCYFGHSGDSTTITPQECRTTWTHQSPAMGTPKSRKGKTYYDLPSTHLSLPAPTTTPVRRAS